MFVYILMDKSKENSHMDPYLNDPSGNKKSFYKRDPFLKLQLKREGEREKVINFL